MRLTTAIGLLAVSSLLGVACATSSPAPSSGGATETTRLKASPSAETSKPDFLWKTFKIQAPVTLDEFEYGLMIEGKAGPRLLIKLIKIHEQEYQEPGQKPVVTTQAELSVRSSPDDSSPRRVIIDEDDSKWAGGCKLRVTKARVDYIESRQKWLPRAVVSVQSCKP